MRIITAFLLVVAVTFVFAKTLNIPAKAAEDTIVLRVCNWEEYIDEGDWDEEETIDLDSGDIIGKNPMVEDFEEWYYEQYGRKVKVEYSTFGTNEELYSQLNLGDTFDLVCPSDYMIMKLMTENKLVPLSDGFFDRNIEENYYVNGVSPYINKVFSENEINGEAWAKYAAGYMWGITGFVYNPEEVAEKDVKTWGVLRNSDYYRKITTKDNVRDAYFPTLGELYREKLLAPEFINRPDYSEQLSKLMNDTSPETIEKAEAMLKDVRNNVYAFETDSGKADMVSGKVLINLQWSGDGVYSMDQAEEDGVELCWSVPEECTNLWFDGWVMLKSGIDGDIEKQHAAEAFINYLSRPDNVVRNMYYIGYTSVISGGEDSRVYEYCEWTYGADDDEEETVEYPVGYFFCGDNEDEDYILEIPASQLNRQISAQYPSEEEIARSAVMQYFAPEVNDEINRMWINIRCFNLSRITGKQWRTAGIVLAVIVLFILSMIFKNKIFVKRVPKGFRPIDYTEK